MGKILSELKETRGKTCRKLKAETGIPNSTIVAILNGRTLEPDIMNEAALAHALGITADELYWRVKLAQEKEEEADSVVLIP